MSRMILVAVLAVLSWAMPAAAQTAWDWRIDPQVCYWTWTCDYGGRAYAPRWGHGHRWAHGHRWVHHVRLHHDYYARPYIYDPSYPHW